MAQLDADPLMDCTYDSVFELCHIWPLRSGFWSWGFPHDWLVGCNAMPRFSLPLLTKLTWNRPSHLFTICQCVCFAFESIEISRFKLRTLEPRFYLLTQTLKVVVYTLSLSYEVWLQDSNEYLDANRHPLNVWVRVSFMVLLLTILQSTIFYISFLYALYIFVRQQPMRRTTFTKWWGSASHGIQESYPVEENVLLPHSVNSSQSVRADSMIIVQALEWLNLGGSERQDSRSFLYPCFFWICLPIKYAVGYFVCLFVVSRLGVIGTLVWRLIASFLTSGSQWATSSKAHWSIYFLWWVELSQTRDATWRSRWKRRYNH